MTGPQIGPEIRTVLDASGPGWQVPFLKGHGTGNDFILLPDLDGELTLSPAQVRAVCDRHAGVGADGILRVVPTALADEARSMAGQAAYFMDHRNADGSSAQMCGNGARLFAHYLRLTGLETSDEFTIATRGGCREVRIELDGRITIDMGTATTPLLRAMPVVESGGHSWSAVGVMVPNPHAVAFVDDLCDVGDLRAAPAVAPAAMFPDGVNVEFAVVHAPDHVSMRVHERGVGETQACGTGACAVAWAVAQQQAPEGSGSGGPVPQAVRVDMPGGKVEVRLAADGRLLLCGPAVIVAGGTLSLPEP